MTDVSNQNDAYTGQAGVRYQVYAPSVPCSNKYRRLATIYVIGIDEKSTARFVNIANKCIIYKRAVAERVDSRSQSMNSYYGQSYKEARELAKRLNTESLAAEAILAQQAA